MINFIVTIRRWWDDMLDNEAYYQRIRYNAIRRAMARPNYRPCGTR